MISPQGKLAQRSLLFLEYSPHTILDLSYRNSRSISCTTCGADERSFRLQESTLDTACKKAAIMRVGACMIVHERRGRPAPWDERKRAATYRWMLPFTALEWTWEWIAFALSNWTFLEVLEHLGRFSVLVGVVLYFSEAGDRVKQRHYQAWQVINTAQGKGGSGGRIEALQELNADKVPLVGVDVSSGFLQDLHLREANLLRSNFSAADLRNSDLTRCNFTLADLTSANLRGATLDHTNFSQADLRNADLAGSHMTGADLSGAHLDETDLRSAELKDIQWQQIKSMNGANVAALRNAPPGFVEWALKNGAVDQPNAPQ